MLFHSSQHKKIKVCDFGIAGKCQPNDKEETDAGTITCMPPEVLSGENNDADPSIDIWGLGVMMFIMMYKELPFNGESPEEVIKKVIEDDLEFRDDIRLISPQAKDIITRMLEKDPKKRISMYEIFDHEWLFMT